MDIRPHELPELRAEIASQIRHPLVARSLWPGSSKGWPKLEAWLADTTRKLEMYYAAPDMAELAVSAAESLEQPALLPDDLPARHGLIAFAGQGCLTDDKGNQLRGFSWYSQGASFLAMPVLGIPRVDGRQPDLAIEPSLAFTVPLDGAGGKVMVRNDSDGEAQQGACAVLVSAWLLMAQPLAEQSAMEPDRAVRKRLLRQGCEASPVRVIELRRPKGRTSEPGESGRSYSHRWITRGHWRQQWYPGRQVHRPVWIAPHVKGPEGAPLIGAEKVYAWKR